MRKRWGGPFEYPRPTGTNKDSFLHRAGLHGGTLAYRPSQSSSGHLPLSGGLASRVTGGAWLLPSFLVDCRRHSST